MDLLISDLHLGPQRPQLTELCLKFLTHQACDAKRLFILGDFFEYWLGDDAIHPHYQPVISALQQLSNHGVEILFMHGNRDFLVGQQLADLCGITLLKDPTIVEIGGQATLLSHGDILCTDDLPYQQFRMMVRDEDWQAGFLSKSLEERQTYAEQARKASQDANQQKSQEIMDVNQQAVVELMLQHNVTRLIHGHTHRPKHHHFSVGAYTYERIVLSDWDKHGHYLICSDHECKEMDFS